MHFVVDVTIHLRISKYTYITGLTAGESNFSSLVSMVSVSDMTLQVKKSITDNIT